MTDAALVTLKDGRTGWIVKRESDTVLVCLKGEGGLCVPVPLTLIANKRCDSCSA